MKRRLLLLAALVVTAALAVAVTSSSNASTNVKNFKHVFVFMMENTGIEALQGNPNAPWINQAIQTYGVAATSSGSRTPASRTTSLRQRGRGPVFPMTTT